MGDLKLSLVIPVFNEEGNLEILHSRIHEALRDLAGSYEIIFVDDGSTDGSFKALRELHRLDDHVIVIRFRRNFGQTAAFAAGFKRARGEVVVTMDADLQNDPADIPRLLEKIEEGFDVVSGWRVNRKDRWISRRLPSMLANLLISQVTGVHLHDYGCSLKAYRREVVKNVSLYGELHRFIPALASWMGTEIAEIPVNHFPRRFGRSKYGISRITRVFLDLLTVRFLLSYATRPLQIFGLLGLFSFFIGGAMIAYLGIVRLIFQEPIANRPLLTITILLIMVGVQLITMGLLGEMTARTYHETQDKPIYAIREVLDGDASFDA